MQHLHKSLPKNTPAAYFPIVWSAYNPQSVQLVAEQMAREKQIPLSDHQAVEALLPEHSEHRGHWRIWGKGMYVMRGSDARRLKYDTKFEGWGLEDVDFFERVRKLPARIFRRIEPGLIHTWHPKHCNYGKEIFTEAQMSDCLKTQSSEDGSELGRQLLAEYREKQSAAGR